MVIFLIQQSKVLGHVWYQRTVVNSDLWDSKARSQFSQVTSSAVNSLSSSFVPHLDVVQGVYCDRYVWASMTVALR